MSIRYEIRADVVFVEITGVKDLPEIGHFYDALAEDPAFVPGTPFLVDLRSTNATTPRTASQGAAVAPKRRRVFSVPTKVASLVSTTWMFGVSRQWAALSCEANMIACPFYDESAARAWLFEPVDDPADELGRERRESV